MELFLLLTVVTALYFSESDGLSVTLMVPNPTTVTIVPPDNSNVTLSWNYTLDSGEQLAAIAVGRIQESKKQDLVSYDASKPNNDGVIEQFKSRMNFSITGDKIHLVINNLVVNDGGFDYECQVIILKPRFKTVSAIIQLIVRVAAHNVSAVCDDAVLGQAMMCNCTADGDPAPTNFHWRASSGSVLGNGNSYTTPSVERTLNGSYYTCVVSNGFGPNASKNTSIFYVKGKPSSVEISPYPSVPVNETGNTTLTCKASGGNPAVYHYKWHHNGNDISGGENGTLTLIDVQRNQTGRYSCQGCNEYGCASNSSSLIVQYKPNSVQISPHPSVTVIETGRATLKCNASGGYPAVYHYKWQHNGNDISGEENGTLTLTDVQRNQTGNYFCQGCNMIGCISNATTVIVQYKPDSVQLSPYPSVTLNETDDTTLQCQASGGNPDEHSFKWQHNGIDISGSVNKTLHLMNVLRSQSGNYSCLGCNMLGCTSNTTAVVVQYKPIGVQISPHPVITINISGNATLQCQAAGGNPVGYWYKWKVNEKDINKGENGTLLLFDIQSDEGGDYSCFGCNVVGCSQNSTNIIVQQKPTSIQISPHPLVAVNETDHTTLKCQASGGYPILYQYKWKYKGNDIDEEQNATLNLDNVQRNQSGNYSCQGCNMFGCTINSTIVIVQYKPDQANICVTSLLVNESKLIKVTCQGYGGFPANYRYTWRLNGKDLHGGSDGELQLIATRNHGGTLVCFANNDAGYASATATVIVQYPPSGVELTPSPVANVNVTENITLVCEALDGVPSPTEYRWERNGQTISGGMDGTLLLSSVNKSENDATYKCFAFNIMGTSSPGTTNINVQYQPSNVSIVADPDSTVAAGKSLTLICTFDSGNLPVSIEWKLKNAAMPQQTDRSLVIQKVGVLDSGTYKCTAMNILGNAAGKIDITVTPDKCVEKSCSGNGNCTIQSDGVKKCKCKEGWHGENCNTCTCNSNGTANGGCDVIDGQRICQCKDEYSGDLCELHSDEYDIVKGRFALTDYAYEDWMNDIKSNQAKQFIAMVRPLLQNGTSAKGCKITKLTNGSVEIHFELFFEKGKKEEKKEAVKKFIEGGKLGNYTIKEGSLVFQGTGDAVKNEQSTEAVIIIVVVVVVVIALVISIIALVWICKKGRCERR